MNVFPDETLINRLREEAAQAENRGQLTEKQLSSIYEHQWFLIFVPKELGGAGLSLPEALELEECLAKIDGSLGWTVTLCSGAGWFSGFMEPEVNKAVFNHPKTCIGGSGAPTGVAIPEKNGYRINGHWKFATGAPHLSHFTANCVLHQQGKEVLDAEGKPVLLSFIFERKEVVLKNDWHPMGLIATASHSFSIKDHWVPK